MNDESPTIVSQKYLILISVSIVLVAVIAIYVIFFYHPFPLGITMNDKNEIIRGVPGLNVPFPTTGNDCLSDFETYIEIKNRNSTAGWIHYGNSTEIQEYMEKYCSVSPDDYQLLKDLQV